MAFVDELVVYIKAGNGGNGAVRWRREKFAPKGGPAGGNGGNGGDVFLRGVKDTSILQKYKFKKEFIAEDGEGGKNNLEHGKGARKRCQVPFLINITMPDFNKISPTGRGV